MEPSDFYLVVTPLAGILFVLVILVIFYAEGEEITSKKLEAFEARKARQDRAFTEEVAKLDEMRASNSIDDLTYDRLRRLLTHAQANDAIDDPTRQMPQGSSQ